MTPSNACPYWSEVEYTPYDHTKEWCKAIEKSCICAGERGQCSHREVLFEELGHYTEDR